jgi:hypothetical protein
MDRADTWKWSPDSCRPGLHPSFRFLVAGRDRPHAHEDRSKLVPVIWSVAGRDTRMRGPAISATATIGYCGFLTGPPIIGLLAVMIGLRQAMGAIVLCGIMVTVGPMFFPLQATSRSSDEEAVTTGASVF